MFNDSFKQRYTTLPFAYYCASHGENDSSLIGNEISHNHKETEIIIVTNGTVRVSVNNREPFMARCGDIIIINPYEYHSFAKPTGESFSHICICFDLCILHDDALVVELENGRLRLSSLISSELSYTSELFEYVKQSVDLCQNVPQGWELRVVGYLSCFFGILKQFGHICNDVEIYKDEFSKSVISVLKTDYACELSSGILASRLGLTASYFCRKFKAGFGYVFSEYLCMYRIERSKELLKSSSIPVSEIAEAVGFSSFSYFSKMFKFYMKLTPSEYRKKYAC